MPIKHLVSSSDFSKKEYEEIIRRFNLFLEKGIPSANQKFKSLFLLGG